MAATKRTGKDQDTTMSQVGRVSPRSRAIGVPLARVIRGQPRALPALGIGRSAPLAAVIAPLPKLTVRKLILRGISVPDRAVISGDSRSLTGTPHRRSPGISQVRQRGPRTLQAGSQWAAT